MARRRGKSSSKQDDSCLPVDSPAGQSSRNFNEYVIPGVLLLIIAVGGSGLFWVCTDHQQMIESLSETLASFQARITKLQQQLGPDSAQLSSVGGFEERLMSLEDAYAKAQKQVALALATSEQIKSKDLQNKVWSLQTEMNDKLAELQQNTFSIAALNSIIKNKSVEFEILKQSVNTMSSANAELAMQIAGFASTLSVTKSRLDEHISFVYSLVSQLEGQKKEINEIKELFDSNQETLAINTQELMDIKELVESEQIKRTQKLEKQLKSLYKRLEDHQMATESFYFHLAAKMEALQTQQPSTKKEIRVTMSENKDSKATEKGLENVEEDEFKSEEPVIVGKDQAKEKDIIEQDTFKEDKASERPVEEPVKEIQTSEEPDIKIEKEVTKKQKEVNITKETKTLQEMSVVINEIEKTAVADVQTYLENSDIVVVKTVEKASIVTSETGKQLEVPAAEALFEDVNTAPTDTEEAAGEKQEKSTLAQEGSETIEILSDRDHQDFSEEHSEEHTAEENEGGLNEVFTAEMQDDGIAEQTVETAVTDMTDKTDNTANRKVEQEAEEELTRASAKKSKYQ